ncbi:pectinesterase family protein [Cellulomonas sp. Leaf395]|uniref:pectinesterase family protein n=1 Tax=Cellulomonas sp. Leaf395 TaxID=1736362 RepID=UPI0009E6F7B4|nr:pectinesterase family protein [Cellulomonas sp. Leaf395]
MRFSPHPLVRAATATACVAALAVTASPAQAAPGPAQPPTDPSAVARETLATGDGWASFGNGTTGGSAATPDQVFTVSTRDELAAAVAGDQPKIVYIDGTIDGNVDEDNQPLTCADFARDGYTLEAFLEAYDPATWGKVDPAGPLEDARRASQRAQAARVQVPIGSNTTLVGLPGALVKGANLKVDGESNVILRGVEFQNAYDCFPAWDPGDGEFGEWNSEYDPLSLYGATNVWIDSNEFSDEGMPDSEQPTYYGRQYQVHDALLDITHGSDLVTVSWNRFRDHDKVMLIGSSDSRTSDDGKLRITLHHNEWRDLGQRTPRVRYGQVDVYNNLYVEDDAGNYQYSWGIGVQSKLVAEHNAFTLAPTIEPSSVIKYWKGTTMTEGGNLVNGEPVDLLAAHNAAHDPDIAEGAGWTPTLRRTVHPATSVPRVVGALAGPQGLGRPEHITVAQGNGGDVTSVQAAVDAAPTASTRTVEIVIEPGVYREVVRVDRTKPKLSFVGATGRAEDVVITYDNAAGTPKPDGSGTYGTSGSATATLAGADFTARYLTFENSFDEQAHPEITNQQAVAVKTTADRMVFDNVRFLGNQDTLYLDSPNATTPARAYVHGSWIEGDVDFIFGRASAVIDGSTIKALKRDSDPNGYVVAPSTSSPGWLGFLVTDSKLISNAKPDSYFLGRPWRPSSFPSAEPQVVVRDSFLGNHIKDDPWTSMSGRDWSEGRALEYRNDGPGAGINPDRPQLTDAQAADYEIQDYLSGSDGWDPTGNTD